MPLWRYVLIAAYVVVTMAGVVVGRRQFVLGMSLIGAGLVAIAIHLLLERIERKREEELQNRWQAEIRRIAEDVNLEEYGIPSLAELARYHDAAGRAEVLDALRTLPSGERTLANAARLVDADAAWD